MQVLRPVLCRRLPAVIRRHPPIRRQQNYGPHKEYFQTPGQAPLPDTTPYDPHVPIQTQVVHQGPSRKARFARSLGWATLFSALGAAAATALITLEYLQPPFEPGSEEEQELQSEINELLEANPVVEGLRSQGWIEENFYDQKLQRLVDAGTNMIHNLRGTQGLTIKAFRHPNYTITTLVFFAGSGVEGWPDVMHGGIITSLLLEATARQFKNHYSVDFMDLDRSEVIINFKRRARPGEIYTVSVPPAAEVEDVPNEPGVKKLAFLVPMLQAEAAPEVRIETDPATQHKTLNLAFAKGEAAALAAVRLWVVPKNPQAASNFSNLQDKHS